MSQKKKRSGTVSVPKSPNTTVVLPENITKDELKQLIVDAYFEIEQAKAVRQESEHGVSRKLGNPFKNIWYLLCGKHKEELATTSLFALVGMVFFSTLAFYGVVVVIGLPFAFPKLLQTLAWNSTAEITNSFFSLFTVVMAYFAIILLTIMSFVASREMTKTKDKHFVVGVFSGLVSLVALIVAVIALVKGVA